jgi:alkylation response protein AidB-like acyl-CoA dehydrogenase
VDVHDDDALVARVRQVLHDEVRQQVLEVADCCTYPADLFAVLAREHLLGLSIPAAYGGGGRPETTSLRVVEELARISGTVSLMAAYVTLTSLPIQLAGTEDQKRRLLPPLCSGEQLGSYAVSEPEVGSDPASLTTLAERHGDTWVLNGTKRFIGNAPIADVFVVFARTGQPGPRGLSAFVVDGHAPGVSTEPLRTMGMPGWQLGAPRFEDVEVPAADMLGVEGDGFALAMRTFDRSRPTVAAQSVGLAQGAVDLALDYAVRRHTFGEPLIAHQAVSFALAGLEAEIAAARALTREAGRAVEADDPSLTKLAAMAKMVSSDVAMRATTQAVQVLGGNGYLKDFPAERMMRDAKVLQIYEGANEIQKLVIGRLMRAEADAREPVWPECMPGTPDVADGTTAERERAMA